jgi:hypothetical protein
MPENQIKARALTRGEIKALRKEGINLASFDGARADEIIDRVLALVCTEQQIEELDKQENPVSLDLFEEICKLSFPSDREIKNS